LSPLPLGEGLGTTYDVYLGLIEKRVVDFYMVVVHNNKQNMVFTKEDKFIIKVLQQE